MVLTICFYPRQSFFIKQKQIWNYLIFCMIFKEEYFYSYILLTDQISLLINWPNLLLEILDNMCIVIFVMQSVTSKINHCFLNKLFFHITTRSGRAFNMKSKAYFIIFKGLSITRSCLRPESASLIAYDFSLFSAVWDPSSTMQLCKDVLETNKYTSQWKITINLGFSNKPKRSYLVAKKKILITLWGIPMIL